MPHPKIHSAFHRSEFHKAIFLKADQFEFGICLNLNRIGCYRFVRHFFRLISRLGDGVFWYSLISVLAIINGYTGFKATAHIILMGLICLVTYKILKRYMIRERPFISFQSIKPHTQPLDRYSFPSGHTMNAVNFAVMVCYFFPLFFWLVVLFSVLVAISRIVLGMHYPSDVVIGALLGGAMAYGSLVVFPAGLMG